MRKNKKEVWTNLYVWLFICSLIGILICMVVLLLFSIFLYNVTEIIKSFTLFSVISLLVGSFFGGYFCGLFRRNNGLYEGIFCGFVMYIMLLIIGGIFFHSFANLISIRKLMLCVIPSAVGGIVGVNRKRPKGI